VADYIELWGEFVKGKQTRRGQPLPDAEMPKPETVVTICRCEKIDAFIGSRNRAERLAHLRDLRDREILICDSGRLTQSLMRGSPGVSRGYVFRREASKVPRVPRESKSGDRPIGSATGSIRKILEV
jgi:hypothetical protein